MVFGGDKRDRDGDGRPGEGGILNDLIRRAVVSGVQAVFSTEDGVRALMGAIVPRELIQTIASQVDATKREAVSMVGREMHNFLENLNVGDEIAKILTSVTFEIRTEVRFVPNEDGTLRSEVKASAKPKVANRAPATAEQLDEDERKLRAATRATVKRVVEKLTERTVARATGDQAADVDGEAGASKRGAARRSPSSTQPEGDGESESDSAG